MQYRTSYSSPLYDTIIIATINMVDNHILLGLVLVPVEEAEVVGDVVLRN